MMISLIFVIIVVPFMLALLCLKFPRARNAMDGAALRPLNFENFFLEKRGNQVSSFATMVDLEAETK